METASESADALRSQITATESELEKLKALLAKVEAQDGLDDKVSDPVTRAKWPLSAEEYQRYGRQMIVPNIGIQGQLRLRSSSVLIVGAGGLGCPAAAYIAGAGVGTIGVVDGDVVEISNLHRQILHSTAKVGMKKVDSVISYLKTLNPNISYNAHNEHLSPLNAPSIVANYDLVLDCTDHPTSRYLISDICVLLSKPLISASALRTDGQLITLNYPPLATGNAAGGPCYRCVFPKPPPAESVVSCGEGGILGPVVGVMGVLQALEAVKLIAEGKLDLESMEKKVGETNSVSMLLLSANSSPPFRNVKLRARRPKCFACSEESTLTLESLTSGSLDYIQFCGVTNPVTLLKDEERISAKGYEILLGEKQEHLLIDVREKLQFEICSLENATNVPFSSFQTLKASDGEKPKWLPDNLKDDAPIYLVCRLGNDSQVVVRKLKDMGLDFGGKRYIGDIKGGLKAWKEEVDSSWPEY